MAIRRLSPKTQYQYIRHVKKFADFVGRSAEKQFFYSIKKEGPPASFRLKTARLTISR
jgi:hypothetical protein